LYRGRNGCDLPRQPLAGNVVVQKRAAELDQQLHNSPSASGYPSNRLIF
jgi:hypothetical protein